MGSHRILRLGAVLTITLVAVTVAALNFLRSSHAPPVSAIASPSTAVTSLDDELQPISPTAAWVMRTSTGEPATSDGRLLEATNDGGRTWRRVDLPAGELIDYQLIDTQNAALLERSRVMVTSDSGGTWLPFSLPPGQQSALGLRFTAVGQAWYQDLSVYPGSANQPSSLWWKPSASEPWQLIWEVNALNTSAGAIPLVGVKKVLGFDGTRGWLALTITASDQLIQTQTGATWQRAELPIRDSLQLYEVQQLAASKEVLIARTGTAWWALVSLDGGQMWSAVYRLPIGLDRNSYGHLSLLDLNRWYIPSDRLIFESTDGGQTWSTIEPTLPSGIAGLSGLWLYRGGKGWATAYDAAANSHVLVTSDGGIVWSIALR